MDMQAAQLPAIWLWLTWMGALGLGGVILAKASWRMLEDQTNLHVFLGACVAVLVFWMMKAGIRPGLNFHLLGMTVLTLMFRPLFALLAAGVVVLALASWQGGLAAAAMNWIVLGWTPVAVTWCIHRLARRWLPRNLFVYLFINAFFAAGLAMGVTGLFSAWAHHLAGAYPARYLLSDYLPYYFLMSWSEAVVSGMLMTVLTVWKPEWVGSFQDSDYGIASPIMARSDVYSDE